MQRKHSGHLDHSTIRSAASESPARLREKSDCRGDIDNASPALLQCVQESLNDKKARLDVGVDHSLPVRFSEIARACGLEATRTIDQDIEPSQPKQDGIDDSLTVVGRCNVPGCCDQAPARAE